MAGVPAPGAPPPTVAVRGEAEFEVDPETVHLHVTVSARDRDRSRTLSLLTGRLAELREQVAAYGSAVERADTGALWVRPEHRGSRRPGERVAAYHGSAELRITVVDFGVLGELVLRLADRDMTVLRGPWWGLRPDSPVHRQARERAVAAALERARQYAAALGSSLTGLVELADCGLDTPYLGVAAAPAVRRGPAAPGGAAEPELELEPVRQRVAAAVEARFTITPPSVLSETEL